MNKTPKLRFKEFSGDWESKKLHQVSDVLSGKRVPKGMNLVEYNTGIPYITVSDMGDKYVALNKLKYITPKIEECIKKYKVLANDIIISVAGTLGKINLIQSELENANLTENCDKITNLKNANYKYLYYYLNTEHIQNQISSVNTISSQPKLALACIRDFNIAIPDLKEQEKIASLFSLIDDKISLQAEKVETLKDYKKGMMQKIFSRELRFKDDDGRDYPEWEEKKIGNIAECLDNKRKPLNSTQRGEMQGDIPYYGANGIVDFVNDYIFDEEIILLAEDGGNFEEFATRPIAQLVTGKSWVNNHAHVLKSKHNTEFLFYSLVHKDIRKYINGTSRAKLNKSDMLDIVVNIPKSLEEQKKIANVLGSIYLKIEKEQKKLDSLNEYKKGLLQQMFV